MRKMLVGACVAAILAASAAQAEDKPDRSLGDELDKAVKELDAAVQDALRSVEKFIDGVPGYEAPEVLPNGDIIIRKKPPKPDSDAPPPTPDRRDI